MKRKHKFPGSLYLKWASGSQSAPTAAMGFRESWITWLSTLYQGAQATPVTADGQSVYDMNGLLGVVANSYFRQATAGNRPLYKTGGAGGKPYLLFDGTASKMVSLASSNFLAVNAKTIIIAVSVEGAVTVNADNILGDTSSPWHMVTPTDAILRYTNYDTSYKYSTGASYTAGTPLVYAVKHDGGALYDAKNGGAWSAGVTAGNTGSLATALAIGGQGTFYTPMRLYGAALANVVVSDANIALVVNYFKSQLGIS